MTTNRFCEITHELQHLSKLSEQCARIDPALYAKYDVKRGLRDINGKGVLVGLTEISDVCSTKMIDGKLRPADGELITAVIMSKILSTAHRKTVILALRNALICFFSGNFLPGRN